MADREHLISLSEATKMTAKARAERPEAVLGWRFHRDILDTILAQPSCDGVRIYMGVKADGSPTPVIVGTSGGGDLAAGPIGEEAWPCPPYCDEGSPLRNPQEE